MQEVNDYDSLAAQLLLRSACWFFTDWKFKALCLKLNHFFKRNPYCRRFYTENHTSTLRQNPNFYPEITKNLMFEKCKFGEKWDFENVNFVKNETLQLWILWKVRFSKCEFLDKLRFFAQVWKLVQGLDFCLPYRIKHEILYTFWSSWASQGMKPRWQG